MQLNYDKNKDENLGTHHTPSKWAGATLTKCVFFSPLRILSLVCRGIRATFRSWVPLTMLLSCQFIRDFHIFECYYLPSRRDTQIPSAAT